MEIGRLQMARQSGYIYEAFGAWHVRFYQSEQIDGKLVRKQKSHRLCAKDRAHQSKSSVKDLCIDFMRKVNHTNGTEQDDMRVVDFWKDRYLPYCEEVIALKGQDPRPRMRPSTVRGFKQIWNQHLEAHFGKLTLQEYEPRWGMRLLRSLTSKQGKTTLKHIKSLATALFSYAVTEEILKVNPWREVKVPKDAIEPKETEHYTLEEAENIISALVDHVDAQLVMALSCFLGLRPGELASLKWEDLDKQWIHIRRNVVRGKVGAPKTQESIAPVPLINQVRVPLELWHQKSDNPKEGWVFPSEEDTPVDLHNLVARVIRPHVEGKGTCVRCKLIPEKSGVRWKGLYAGRRCAATAVIEATGGNYAVAQALLRHKKMDTTVRFYKKAITPQAFEDGMQQFALKAAAKEAR